MHCSTTLRRIALSAQQMAVTHAFLLRKFEQKFINKFMKKYSKKFSTMPRLLLGASILSFSQDTISDEEMNATLQGFSLTPKLELEDEVSTSTSASVPDCSSSVPVSMKDGFAKSKLHVLQRFRLLNQLNWTKLNLLALEAFVVAYSQGLISMEERLIEHSDLSPRHSGDEIVTNFASDSCSGVNGGDSAVPRPLFIPGAWCDMKPDGTGFVNDQWEQLIKKPEVCLWRRKLESSHLYEYRISGSFHDISARSLLAVQVNLQYRRRWDSNVVYLALVDGAEVGQQETGHTDTRPDSGTETVQWIANMPGAWDYREYVYLRRWWLDAAGGQAMLVSRAVPEQRKTRCPLANCDSLVRITTYQSNMLICASGDSIDQPGVDYYLTYADDPQLLFPTGWFASAVIPKFVEQLHQAAIKLEGETIQSNHSPHGAQTQLDEDARFVQSKSSSTAGDGASFASHSLPVF